MVSLASFVIPLLAIWLWWPVQSLSRITRGLLIAITIALGIQPAILLKLVQTGGMKYTTAAYLQVPGGWVLSILLMLVLFLLVRDGLWIAAKLGKSARLSTWLHRPSITFIALCVSALTSALGVWNALQAPQVHEKTLHLKNLPAEMDGLRVAVLADIHASPINNASYVQTIVNRTLAVQPDLIVLPGDMVDGDVASGRANVAPLAQLKAPHGVWLTPGNHEYYSGYDAWMAEFRQLGLNVLENRTQAIAINGATLALSGIGDPVYGRTSPNNTNPEVAEGVPPDIDAVAQQAKTLGAKFHLLLAHQPKFARDNAAKGVDLQISGHTHGGLVLGMDQLVVAPVNNGYVRGLYEVGGMQLLVSSGAGLWAGFAIRLGVAPSIDLLVLKRA